MSLTIQQMVQRVGEELSLVPIGQDLESQDNSRILAAYSEVYQRLKTAGKVFWASTADIPTAAVPYVALLVAEKLLNTYSVPESRYQRIMLGAGENGVKAAKDLVEAMLEPYESTEEETDF